MGSFAQTVQHKFAARRWYLSLRMFASENIRGIFIKFRIIDENYKIWYYRLTQTFVKTI